MGTQRSRPVLPTATRRMLAVVITFAMTMAACGGDDADTASPEFLRSIATEVENAEDSTFDAAESACVAEAITGGIELERLAELEVTEDDPGLVLLAGYTEDEKVVLESAFLECKPDVLYALLTLDDTFAPDDARCLADEIPSDVVGEAVLGGFRGEQPPPAFAAALFQAFGVCNVTP